MTRFTPVRTRTELDAAFDASSRAPVIVFKHSESCGVSLMARGLLEDGDVPADVYEIVVQRSRELSNDVAALTGVRHESPQVLVLVNRRATWHSSHAGVTSDRITRAWHEAAGKMTGTATATVPKNGTVP